MAMSETQEVPTPHGTANDVEAVVQLLVRLAQELADPSGAATIGVRWQQPSTISRGAWWVPARCGVGDISVRTALILGN